MKKITVFLIIYLFSNICFSQIPSGYSLWLRSDAGLTKNGTNISEWTDKANPTISAKQATESFQPMFVDSSINGNPVVRFYGAQYMEANPIYPVNRDYTLFIVVSMFNFNSSNNIFSGDLHAVYSNPPHVLHGNFNTQSISTYSLTLNIPAIITVRFTQNNQVARIYLDGLLGDSAVVGSNTDSVIYLGAYQKGNFLLGDLAEVILYPNSITDNEQNQVQDYLFSRYAIEKPKPPEIDSTFTEVPAIYQLYHRGKNDSAEVKISGNFKNSNYDSIYTKIFKDNLLIETITHELDFKNGSAAFLFNPKIHAELNQYKFVIGVKNADKDSIITVRDSVVCGDVILINGQSNSIYGGNSYTNEYIRTFGGNFSNNVRDTLWSLASGYGSGGGNSIGAWGMRLAQLIVEDLQVPVCVINGGVGGTTIEQHLRQADKFDLSSIYGSMLYRAEKSKLRDAAKVLFWYQGESNGIANYFENFKTLYYSWLEDYPNLKKLYTVQIHTGCFGGPHFELRDLQRRMGDTLRTIPIETIAASGLPGHDGCHFSIDGYLTLGKQFFRQYVRDFFGSTDTIAISSPNINKAFFTDDNENQLALVFKPNLSNVYVQPDTTVNAIKATLKDYFYLNDSVKINSLICKGDTLFLNLEKPSTATNVTYLPEQYYNGTIITYEGPYLYNQRGIGAMSFYQFPITDKAISGIRIIKDEKSIYIMPDKNPSDGNFNLIVENKIPTTLEITINSLDGAIIYEYNTEILPEGEHSIPISLDATEGVYICNVNTGKESKVLKLILVK